MTIKVQVLREFLNHGRLEMEGRILDVSESRAVELEGVKLVTREIRMDRVHYIPPEPTWKVSKDRLPKLNIGIPAWGDFYVGLACNYVIPAIKASLAQSNFDKVCFIVHTDQRGPFIDAIGHEITIKFPPLLPLGPMPKDQKMPRLPENYWVAFKKAHRDIIEMTAHGDLSVLLNSDVVPSVECFKYVEEQLLEGKSVIASVGIRTSVDQWTSEPPIGVTAAELFKWIWGNKHHISKECVWSTGRSQHPTILFFDDGLGNVAMHCFHLTPMFIRRDRHLPFRGTIDDDVLGRFLSEEIAYPHLGEVAFAELSPDWKLHPFGSQLTVSHVVDFWGKRMMRPHYLRNFNQRLNVLGNMEGNHCDAQRIMDILHDTYFGRDIPR